MSQTPPPVRAAEFLAMDITDEDEIKGRFTEFMRLLHSFLNQVPCLRDVQKVRRRWKARTSEKVAFGNLAANPGECYTFHHGGRNEAQFNVGIWPSYLRVGLGFEFSLKKGGDPTAVQLAYTCFVNVVRDDLSAFEHFVADNQLELEWVPNTGGAVQLIPTTGAVHWVLNLPQEPGWLFVGRLLRRGHDASILENPEALGTVMQTVLCGFRPIWERTEVLAHT